MWWRRRRPAVILSDVRRFGTSLLLAAVVVTVACSGGQPPARKAVRIGVDLPLSGAEARAAVPALDGIRFYVQTHPILDGFDVVLRRADDAGDPNLGAANIRALLTDPTLLAVLGPYDAGVARQQIPVANLAGLLMVSPATSNPCLTRDIFVPARLNPARTALTCSAAGLPSGSQLRPAHANNFFRLTTTDELQGAAAADFAFHQLHVLRAAVISDHEVYGQGLADSFDARFTSLGGTVVGRLDLDATNLTASTFLKSVKDAGAQAVYYGGGTAGGGCAVRSQMQADFPAGQATPFLGADGIAQDPACVSAAGANSLGLYATVPIVDADSLPGAAATIRGFKAAFGSTADYGPYTIVAYDATAVVYAAIDLAIREAGSNLPDRQAVRAAMGQLSGLAGATGNLGFDRSGDTTNRVVSVYESTGSDPRTPWKLVGAVDYSSKLPY